MEANDGTADFRDSEYEGDDEYVETRVAPPTPDRPTRSIIFGTSTIRPHST